MCTDYSLVVRKALVQPPEVLEYVPFSHQQRAQIANAEHRLQKWHRLIRKVEIIPGHVAIDEPQHDHHRGKRAPKGEIHRLAVWTLFRGCVFVFSCFFDGENFFYDSDCVVDYH